MHSLIMARHSAIFFASFLAVTGLTGCASTGDPNQGGLFGWSETKAQQRQHDLRRESESAGQAASAESGRTAGLQKKRADMEAQLASQRRQMDFLERDLKSIQANLANEPDATGALESELARLMREQESLSANDTLSIDKKLQKIENLKSDVASLKKRNDALKKTR